MILFRRLRNPDGGPRTVIDGERVHLDGCQLCCNYAHLLVDIVAPHALRESCELALDVSGVLALQRWSSELVAARAMTGCAGWDPTLGVASKD